MYESKHNLLQKADTFPSTLALCTSCGSSTSCGTVAQLWHCSCGAVLVVPQEGIEEVSEGSPKTPLTLSLLLPLPGNQAGANVEVYNYREELREEHEWNDC